MKALVVLVAMLLASPAIAGYEVVDLGIVGNSFATDINCQGQVCGFSFFDETNHAFAAGQMIPRMTEAYGIDNDGTVVGMTLVRQQIRPSVFRYGRTDLLKTLGGDFGYARAVRDGIVVGTAGKQIGNQTVARPCLWFGDRVIELLSQPGKGWASDINHFRQIVGSFFPEGQGPLAFLWQRGCLRFLGPGYASAINDRGAVVGYSPTANGFQATLWRQRNTPLVLPSLDEQTWANDINNLGEIVGLAQTSQGFRAVIWQNGQITDLNELVESNDWLVFSAQAINNRGQIACRGQDPFTGATHALLLNPL